MYWKVEALTAQRTYMTQIAQGHLQDIKTQAALDDVEILNIQPDYGALFKSFFQKRSLSAAAMAMFFKDFAHMQQCGLSVYETINALAETTSSPLLKEALGQISHLITDGRSLQETFEHVAIFPKIVSVTLGSGEKTGRIPELLDVLAQYFKFKSENQKKIIQAMVYPLIIFCLLSGVSVFVTMTLAPGLKMFLGPGGGHRNLSADMLMGYATFIKLYAGWMVVFLASAVIAMSYVWHNRREQCMALLFKVPWMGVLMKYSELSQIFFNMYVYQQSGINIIEAINDIHQSRRMCAPHQLLFIRDLIFKGVSLAEAFKQDPFFPPFVYQNLSKGQTSSNLAPYFERIASYYDIKTKDAIAALIAMVEPTLMVMAAGFLLMIVCAFILPLYTTMAQMSLGAFR